MKATVKEIRAALETFVRGFCAQKSATHAYEFGKIGDVWLMRDAARKNSRYYRKEQWVAYGTPAVEVDTVGTYLISISNVLAPWGTVWLSPDVDSSWYLLGIKLLAGGRGFIFST